MNFIEKILVSVMLGIFPILIYFIYNCYLNLKFKSYNTLFLKISLFTSMYCCLKSIYIIDDKRLLLLCNIPIILAYIKNDKYLGIFLSIGLILCCWLKFDMNIIVLILKYLIYFIAYLIYTKFKYSSNWLIVVVAILQGFFLSFEYFSINPGGVNAFINLVIFLSIFYIITFFCIFLINFGDKITSLFVDVKDLEKEKKLKESLFKITHEIKNPIAVCKGYLDMIDPNNIEKVRRYIPIISQEIDRCLNIMMDFMEFSKIKLNKEEMDINFLLEELYDSFSLLYQDQKIRFEYNGVMDDVYIYGDYNRLKQVMLNIIKNSIESIENDGKIRINSYVKGNNYCIIVEDDGCGMDKETLAKISDLFFTTKKNGTGVGVSLSREIILAHNGVIEYESILNKGTKVTIMLPIVE